VSTSAHKHGQRVLHDGLQTLIFDLVDMHRPYPNIDEAMEFQKGISVKKSLEIFLVWEN
jgi:hypothetical protein